MSTTELSAELLITGTGVALWMAFLTAAIFGLSFQEIVTNTNVFTLVPIVGLVYVLGIIVDRLGYGLFSNPEARILKGMLKPDSTPSLNEMEKFVLTNSEKLGLQVSYNRSRLRICRSWCINFFLIGVTTGIWAYSSNLKAPFFLPLLSLFLTAAAFQTWRKLVKDYFISIQTSYTFLIEQKRQTTKHS
jgi:hypothetical protein